MTTANWTADDVSATTASWPEGGGGGGLSWRSALILCVFVFIIVGTVIGNSLVCAAVAIVRCLRTPSNLLIVSLAVSDLLVASLVMGLAAFYEVQPLRRLGKKKRTGYIRRTVLYDLSVLAIRRTMQIDSRPTEIITHFC